MAKKDKFITDFNYFTVPPKGLPSNIPLKGYTVLGGHFFKAGTIVPQVIDVNNKLQTTSALIHIKDGGNITPTSRDEITDKSTNKSWNPYAYERKGTELIIMVYGTLDSLLG